MSKVLTKDKKKCYILCNINNPVSDYIIGNQAGSNISFYLGESLIHEYDVYLINIGAPKKKPNNKKINSYSFKGLNILEFSSGPNFLPIRIRVVLMLKNAIKFLRSQTRDGDKLIVYHSLSFCKIYKSLIRKFELKNSIILVAELYSDVGNLKYDVEKEKKFCNLFERYIFMSKGLQTSIIGNDNTSKKYIFLFGSYSINEGVDRTISKSRIHLVYAGTNSRIKGGLYNALEAMKYLPEDYLLHVYCPADHVLKSYIDANKNTIYEGYVDEKQIITKLSMYDIGLSTQNPNLKFNTSSFPSKIVTYLACGLSVVSSKSVSVLNSPFNEILHFYDDQSTTGLSEAIITATKSLNRKKSVNFIKQLDLSFRYEIMMLLGNE